MDEAPIIPTERVAIIVWLLSQGHAFTTRDVAALLGLSRQGAGQMMDRISRVVPVAQVDSQWRIIKADN